MTAGNSFRDLLQGPAMEPVARYPALGYIGRNAHLVTPTLKNPCGKSHSCCL